MTAVAPQEAPPAPVKPKYLWVQESMVNRTKNYRVYDGEPYETQYSDMGKLFHAIAAEYGRCESRCYIDLKVGGSKQIGWVFVKRMKYQDVNEYYLQETWVSVHTGPPTRTIEYHYATFPDRRA